MPRIIPIKELCKTAQISAMCKESPEPIYVTKNGFADLVVMDAKAFEAWNFKHDLHEKLEEGFKSLERGEVRDWTDVRKELIEKYGI